MRDVDWSALHTAAVAAMRTAYAPYSRFPVGVAGLVDDGRIVVGCNVENASYGVGLCAECGMVSALHASGGGRLVAVYCVDARGEALMPCGRCRQLLWEHGGPSCSLMTSRGVRPMSEVLPDAFDATDINEITDPHSPSDAEPLPRSSSEAAPPRSSSEAVPLPRSSSEAMPPPRSSSEAER